jgi:hypothetical protein
VSSSGHSARLAALTRALTERWRQTRESWRDVKAREFEEHFIAELESSVASASRGIEELEAILRKIRSDCE